jgi:hypothetical protein
MNPEQLPGGSYLGTVFYTDCNGNAQRRDVYADDYFEICALEGTVFFDGVQANVILIGDCFV